jgi:hypothetical protein
VVLEVEAAACRTSQTTFDRMKLVVAFVIVVMVMTTTMMLSESAAHHFTHIVKDNLHDHLV